jgi:predicted metal-dependent phosphoesterase TrpH
MLIDLHCHSYLSMGCTLDPKQVLQRAESFGLDGVAFTETNTQDGCEELMDLGKRSKVKVFVGLELNTDKGQYLCFFPEPHKAPEPVMVWGSNREKPWSAAECLPKVKSIGAAIVAARPFDKDSGNPAGEYLLTQPGVVAVEGYNPKVRALSNELAAEAAETLKLPCVSGSDARGSLDEIGRGATLFKTPVSTQRELIEALTAGQCWAVMMGELPKLQRPGEAKEADRAARKNNRRRRGMMRR